MEQVAKARKLDAHNRRLDTRARPLASSLSQWLQRYARVLVERELKRQVRKATDEERLREELERLIRIFGLRQMEDAANDAVGGDGSISPRAVLDFLESKEIQITGIMDETRDAVRSDVRRAIAEALAETPQPSAGEIARRIRSSFFGPVDARPFSVSSERAALIARTELVQAENSGIAAGYEATAEPGDEYEWLAYSDGKSGDRHHERMDGVRIAAGGRFKTPLGNKLRYPGDPLAPIKETANCRCSFRLVRSRRR